MAPVISKQIDNAMAKTFDKFARDTAEVVMQNKTVYVPIDLSNDFDNMAVTASVSGFLLTLITILPTTGWRRNNAEPVRATLSQATDGMTNVGYENASRSECRV